LCPPEKTGNRCGFVEGLKLFGSNFLAGLGAMPGDEDTGPGWLAGARVGVLLGGIGRAGRGVSLAARESGSTARAIRFAEDFLGEGASLKINDAGDAVFVSRDGTRRLRFDINRPYPHQSPHAHIDELVDGKWTTKRIYPTDVPHR